MSDPDPSEGEPPADEEYARTYADGYAEGVRTALKDVLEHTSRGFAPYELRLLVQSRLARLGEEVELKRRSLLGPPRRSTAQLFHPPGAPPRPWSPESAPPRVVPGRSYLVKEATPSRALGLVATAAPEFPRVVLVSLNPPTLPSLPRDRREEIRLADGGPAGGATRMALGTLAGRLKEPLAKGALVYLDAVEFLINAEGFDMVLNFLVWLNGQVGSGRAAAVICVNPDAFEARQVANLGRVVPYSA